MGMLGAPIEVKRPLVALKSHGSRREATCRMTHVTTGFVVIQTLKSSLTVPRPQSKTITCLATSPLRIRSKASFTSSNSMRDEIISSR